MNEKKQNESIITFPFFLSVRSHSQQPQRVRRHRRCSVMNEQSKLAVSLPHLIKRTLPSKKKKRGKGASGREVCPRREKGPSTVSCQKLQAWPGPLRLEGAPPPSERRARGKWTEAARARERCTHRRLSLLSSHARSWVAPARAVSMATRALPEWARQCATLGWGASVGAVLASLLWRAKVHGSVRDQPFGLADHARSVVRSLALKGASMKWTSPSAVFLFVRFEVTRSSRTSEASVKPSVSKSKCEANYMLRRSLNFIYILFRWL